MAFCSASESWGGAELSEDGVKEDLSREWKTISLSHVRAPIARGAKVSRRNRCRCVAVDARAKRRTVVTIVGLAHNHRVSRFHRGEQNPQQWARKDQRMFFSRFS